MDPSSQLLVFPDTCLLPDHTSHELFVAAAKRADVIIGVTVTDVASAQRLVPWLEMASSRICFDSDDSLESVTALKGVAVDGLSAVQRLAASNGVWKEGATLLEVRGAGREVAVGIWK